MSTSPRKPRSGGFHSDEILHLRSKPEDAENVKIVSEGEPLDINIRLNPKGNGQIIFDKNGFFKDITVSGNISAMGEMTFDGDALFRKNVEIVDTLYIDTIEERISGCNEGITIEGVRFKNGKIFSEEIESLDITTFNFTSETNNYERILSLNTGEIGPGMSDTDRMAGFRVDRGNLDDYLLLYDDVDLTLRTGFYCGDDAFAFDRDFAHTKIVHSSDTITQSMIPYGITGNAYDESSRFTYNDSTYTLNVNGNITISGSTVALQEYVEYVYDTLNTRIDNEVQTLNERIDAEVLDLQTQVTAISAGFLNIGPPESGPDYSDGLFVDFSEETRLGVVLDRYNEVLRSLAPAPAPSLDDIDYDITGVNGNLSFDGSSISGYMPHPTINIDGLYSTTTQNLGIFNNNTVITGTLADNVELHPSKPASYLIDSFKDGNKGSLSIIVNDINIHTVDLTTFTSGNTDTNDTGFTLSPSTPAKFESGDEFDVFQYRTGTFYIDPVHQINGYNTVYITHVVDGDVRTTDELNWIVDDNTDATTFSNESLHTLVMTGSAYLSGVRYHTSGTAKYDITISNAYKNTYTNGNTITHPITTKCSVSSQAIPDIQVNENDDIVIVNKNVTLDSGRHLGTPIAVNTSVTRTVQSTQTSSTTSAFEILMDTYINASNSTDTYEPLDDEDYRLHSNHVLTDITHSAIWDSTETLAANDGLLVYNGTLKYPDNNFSVIADGYPNPDYYNTFTGNRVYLRKFIVNGSNFNININRVDTSFGSVVSGNTIKVEILLSNTTTNGTSVEWKDATVPFTNDNSIGCYASSFGSNIPTNWGISLGTKNTSTSGGVMVMKITASDAWIGYINSITVSEV